jgi:alpha-glucosidase
MTRPATFVLTLVVFIAAFSSSAQTRPDARLRVTSPDGQIVFILSDALHTRAMDPASNALRYAIDFHRKWFMDESALGLEIEGQPPLGPGMKLIHADMHPQDDAVAPDKTKTVRERYNAALVDLADDAGRKLSLQVCVFDDGVAFRYVLPTQPSTRPVRIEGELTQFVFNKNATVYPFVLDAPANASAIQSQPRAVSNLPPEWRIGLPLLGEVIGVGWVSIAEARMAGYPGIDLRKDKSTLGVYPQFVPSPLELNADPTAVTSAQLPFFTSWRLLIIANNRSDAMASDLAARLARLSSRP